MLEDPKVSADVNTAKGICLELLGCIGSRIQKLIVDAKSCEAEEVQRPDTDGEETPAVVSIRPIVSIVREQDRKALKKLASSEEKLIELLLSTSGEDFAEVSTSVMRWMQLTCLEGFDRLSQLALELGHAIRAARFNAEL